MDGTDALANAVREGAWNVGTHHEALEKLPTMLTLEELWMLAFLAERAGPGNILDLGCFVGGSSFALATGVQRSAARKRIHSFDLFELKEATKHRYLYNRGLPYFPGEDGLQLYQIIVSQFGDSLVAHKGDVLATLTPALVAELRPISLVFLDVCKSPAITDHITRTVLPALEVGTLIVQQDFIYPYTPWAIYPFWALQDELEMLGHTQFHSAIFRVRKRIETNRLDVALLASTSGQQLGRALEDASHWFAREEQRSPVREARRLAASYPEATDEWALMRRDGHTIDHMARWRELFKG